jgi:prepilin-type N-terminal cleavage/methylation domain-containing protein
MKRSAGFTLIEVLAVVLLSSLVLTVAVRFFLQVNDGSPRASLGVHGRGPKR